MRTAAALPRQTQWVIIGGGFAGAATAWALGRRGFGPGIILEQESTCGTHASGRNAAMARLVEGDPVIAALSRRSVRCLRDLKCAGESLFRPTGGLTLAGARGASALESEGDSLRAGGVDVARLTASRARKEFPFLAAVEFETALWCREEGVVDIHALLGWYLAGARETGFTLHTRCRAADLFVERGSVAGVYVNGRLVRADAVVDASGAWAGRLGRSSAPLPLTALRRHLFVSAPTRCVPAGAPLVWVEDHALYFRPDGPGLLLSPCDETLASSTTVTTDPAAGELLAEKIALHAPGLMDLAVSRSWACLRTFSPDRRPVIGADARLSGLFHVSGLGGAGMMCSAAIGELAADMLTGSRPDWIDAAAVAPARLRVNGAQP